MARVASVTDFIRERDLELWIGIMDRGHDSIFLFVRTEKFHVMF